jgi:RNA polymerase sigma factor (sigma-70 family)
MSFSSSLQRLLDQLPFPYDDFEAVNEAFTAWCESPTRERREVIDLWAYAYVRVYFTRKRTADKIGSAADATEAITQAFSRVLENLHTVDHPDRFAGWVSVICKNTFLNLTRSTPPRRSIEGNNLEVVVSAPDDSALDSVLVADVVRRAISRLPNYLQETAHRYLIEGQSFERISDEIEKPVGTVRVYKQRAIKTLCEDPAIQRLKDYLT